jgi:hypothetical protein
LTACTWIRIPAVSLPATHPARNTPK